MACAGPVRGYLRYSALIGWAAELANFGANVMKSEHVQYLVGLGCLAALELLDDHLPYMAQVILLLGGIGFMFVARDRLNIP